MNLKLLKKKDFLLLMLGKLVSLLGTQMQNFALSLYVLKITGSATKFASVLAVTLIPNIILGPIAGVLVDWFDRKRIIVLLDVIRGMIIAIYAVLFKINGSLTLGSIYTLVIITSLASLLFQPAILTAIPSIVKKEELVDANAVNSFILSIGQLLAPAVAGVLFGIYGLFIILVINSISFIASAISETFIDFPKSNKKPSKIDLNIFLKDFQEGIKFIKSKRIMINIIFLGLVINCAFNPIFTVGLPYISKRILFITDIQYGMLESIQVVGMIIAPLLTGFVCRRLSIGKVIYLDILITSLLIAIIGVISSNIYLNLFNTNIIPYISLIIITFMIAIINIIGNVAVNTMFQKEVPLEIMGRVGTVNTSICMGAIPLGQMVIGFLFDKISAWICVSICAVILFITIMLFRTSLCGDTQGKTC